MRKPAAGLRMTPLRTCRVEVSVEDAPEAALLARRWPGKPQKEVQGDGLSPGTAAGRFGWA